jgi:hypothetical protein
MAAKDNLMEQGKKDIAQACLGRKTAPLPFPRSCGF